MSKQQFFSKAESELMDTATSPASDMAKSTEKKREPARGAVKSVRTRLSLMSNAAMNEAGQKGEHVVNMASDAMETMKKTMKSNLGLDDDSDDSN